MDFNVKTLSVLSVLLIVGAACVCAASVFTDDSDAADTSGKTYNVGIVEGGAYAYTPTFSLSGVSLALSGTAAAWLTVSDGVISGTAPAVSTAGSTATYDLTITATTTKPTQTAVQYIHFTVYDTETFSMSKSSLNIYKGQTDVSITASNSYSSGVVYTASNLPGGLSVNSSTGKITGTVTEDGSVGGTTKKATITAKHTASGQSKTYQITFKCFAKLAQNTAGVNSNGTDLYVVNGEDVTTSTSNADYNKVVSNITSGVTYALKSGSSMPSGLTLNSNGTVTGSSTAMGDTTVTVVATHTATGQTAECTLTVHSVAKLAFDSVPTGGIVATAA